MTAQHIRESVVLQNQGLKIFGIFHKPLHTEKFPVVLICHGFGGHKVGRYRVYVDLSILLAEMGIGSLRFDFRGSGDSEGRFFDMTLETEVNDALIALKFLEEHPNVDRSRIGLIGRSLGGAVSIITASKSQSIKSMGLWAPLFDGHQWIDKWENLHKQKIPPSEQALVEIDGQRPCMDFFKQLFNLKMHKHLMTLRNVPMLFVHGLNDNVINYSHTEQYLENRHGSLNKLITLPLSDHDFTPTEERWQMLEQTAKWFQETL